MAHSFITCTHCGKQEDLQLFNSVQSPLVSKMREEQLCFDCAYWIMWMTNPEPNTITISHKLYKLTQPLKTVNLCQARASKMQFLIDMKDRQIYGNIGLILRGTIPSQFYNVLPDRYKFITKDEYQRIYKFNDDKCLSKGCFDRYHCLWYRQDIAEPNGSWNTIPDGYVIGSEQCPSFINKNIII